MGVCHCDIIISCKLRMFGTVLLILCLHVDLFVEFEYCLWNLALSGVSECVLNMITLRGFWNCVLNLVSVAVAKV